MRAILLSLLLLAGCVDESRIAGMPGARCHADLNFAFCLVPLHTDHGYGEAIVTGTSVLAATGAATGDVLGGVSANKALR